MRIEPIKRTLLIQLVARNDDTTIVEEIGIEDAKQLIIELEEAIDAIEAARKGNITSQRSSHP